MPATESLTHNAKPQTRDCLRCSEPFLSVGPWNRICPKCNTDNKHPEVKYHVSLVREVPQPRRWHPKDI